MRIILKQEVDNLGLPGDVVDVADGYGRNFLIPRGLALKATRGALKEAETLTRARKAHEARTMGDAERYRDILQARSLRVPARVDERGHLYGSVGPSEVQRVLKERGHEIDRRRIDVERPIKQLGSYAVQVNLHPQVTAEVEVEVVDVEGEVTLESIEEAARAERAARAAAAETLEERALAAAEELEEAEEVEEASEAAEPTAGGDAAATPSPESLEEQPTVES